MAERGSSSLVTRNELGVLTREIALRVLNVSVSGCLVEAVCAVDVGTLATVRVSVGGEAYSDDVHVVRCQPIAGGSRYLLGTQFLWTSPPHRRSLRWLVSREVVAAEAGSTPAAPRAGTHG